MPRPQRVLRSNTSTPVSTNVTSPQRSIGKSSKEQQTVVIDIDPINDNNKIIEVDDDDDDDDDDEQPLQTQLPLPSTQQYDSNDGINNNDKDNTSLENVSANEPLSNRSTAKATAASTTTSGSAATAPSPKLSKKSARKIISNQQQARKKSTQKVAAASNNDKEGSVDNTEATEQQDSENVIENIDTNNVSTPTNTNDDGNNDTIGIAVIDPTDTIWTPHQYHLIIMDYEQHVIMLHRSTRKSHWPYLASYWDSYMYKRCEYGRMYVRTRLCTLLVDACSDPAYSESSLVAWGKSEWQDFINDLSVTKDACLDPHCNHMFGEDDNDINNAEYPTIPDVEQRERVLKSEERAQHVAFNRRYEIVDKMCQLNQVISPIRKDIELQLQSGSTGPPKGISQESIRTVLDAARVSNSAVVRKHTYRLFVPVSNDTTSLNTADTEELASIDDSPPKPVLQTLDVLKEILSVKPFSLKWLQGRIESLVNLWNKECCGTKQPFLEIVSSLYNKYNSTNWEHLVNIDELQLEPVTTTTPQRDTKERNYEVETLKRRRHALSNNHGDDPLMESRKLAATTKGSGKQTTEVVATKNILTRGKKSNSVVQFDDSDEDNNDPVDDDDKDEDEDEEDDSDDGDEMRSQRLHLPKLPKKPRLTSPVAYQTAKSTSSIRMYTGPPPDDGIFDAHGNVINRIPWSDEEIAALVLGLNEHGVGKWVCIKQDHAYILRNRTTVQIKDKFRNMVRRGELPDKHMAV